MMTLANYGIGSSKQKDPNSAKVLSKSLQIRNRAELALKQCLKSHYKVNADKRNEILNLITDYYSRIPFNLVIWNKYQTKQCIVDSISLLDSKFNPYKAREAFKLVEKMLINLVYLPWHKEFRKIYTYSGQYRLSISGPLLSIEEVLKAAGFEESRECSLHLVLPEDKMPQTDDGESVTSVIFDCMVAQVVLTNIIDIFENCRKAAKQTDENISDVNYYSWIQAYFRERSHQITDRACSSIQELLNNITNHLSKPEVAIKHSAHSDRVASQANQLIDRNGGSAPKSSTSETRYSPKLSAQERTREFLAQQSHEDENLLTISNDLLRLPTSSDGGRKTTFTSSKHDDYDGSIQQRTSGSRPLYADSIQHQSLLNNGYNTHQYHQQALYDRMPSKPVESRDSIDYHHSGTTVYRNSSDSISHPAVEVDIQHNDREPLLPRYDLTRLASHQSQSRRSNNLYDNNDFDASGHLTKSNGAGHLGSGRHEPYFSESSSHPQGLSSLSNHPIRGLAQTKYSGSPYRKYESRDSDNKQLNSSKSYWSCGSCTYNNQVSSEICEMCRNRRSFR